MMNLSKNSLLPEVTRGGGRSTKASPGSPLLGVRRTPAAAILGFPRSRSSAAGGEKNARRFALKQLEGRE
jgi:hypothetical protein